MRANLRTPGAGEEQQQLEDNAVVIPTIAIHKILYQLVLGFDDSLEHIHTWCMCEIVLNSCTPTVDIVHE